MPSLTGGLTWLVTQIDATSAHGKTRAPMTGQNVWRPCKAYGRLIGYPMLKPHDLRHGDARDAPLDAKGTSRPTLSVRTQPGVTTSMARGSPRWRAAKLRINVFSAALLAR
jgi:hypothetical protein